VSDRHGLPVVAAAATGLPFSAQIARWCTKPWEATIASSGLASSWHAEVSGTRRDGWRHCRPVGRVSPRRSMLRFGKPMPYKFNEGRRHKFPRARYRVTNWPDYDAALVRRGELTVWLTEEAIAS
jgi:hypothetical protein